MKISTFFSEQFFFRDIVLFLTRTAAGLMMILNHALPKLEKWEVMKTEFYSWMGLSPHTSAVLVIIAELGAAALLVIGLGSRLAALMLAGAMAVAAFGAHMDHPFSKKELAIVYLIIFAVLIASGPGKYSIDHWIARRKLPPSDH